MCRSAELTLKPLGLSPLLKGKVLKPLIPNILLAEKGNNLLVILRLIFGKF